MFEYIRIRESFATMFFIIVGMMAKLGSFVVILMIVLFAFTSLDFIAFGSSRGRSRTFMASFVSRFQGAIGDVDFESAAVRFWPERITCSIKSLLGGSTNFGAEQFIL